ncbi:flagellar basal body-associated FliL family protein [Maricaulis parjimensis]|uniref:flagellar basal body-associated FliL family protein n=1 Tax=Maricaulis parjimensis TaxID=144023 RepID=UPI00193A1D8E|nr:hypothetical protein [Maricaulis parjimensis]
MMRSSPFLRGTALAVSLVLSAPAMAGGYAKSPPAQQSNEESRHRTLTNSPSYVPIAALTATVQANHRARGLLQIEAGLEVPDAQLRRRVERYMPRLRNAWVTALSVYAGVNYRYGDIPDADRIAEVLQEATDMTLGEEGAQILIGMIIIHGD